MDKYTEIRPIALGLAIKNNKLLVEEKFDKVKNQTFYRCLGGGIEFLEKSSDALKREFKEEINTDIVVKDFLGISENIFTFNGKNAHELILFYSIDIADSDYKDEYNIIDKGGEFSAKWINFILYLVISWDISQRKLYKNGERCIQWRNRFCGSRWTLR